MTISSEPVTGLLSELEEKVAAARALVAAHVKGAATECVTCSFQAEDMIVLHMVRAIHPSVPVLFLDTGYHFAETYTYRDQMAAAWNLNLINLTPRQTVPEQEAQFGILHQSAPDQCCKLRKVEPLFAALAKYETWFTGMRREQAKSRAQLEALDYFTLPGGKQLLKLSPLAEWTTRDVWYYAQEQGIPLLPLYDKGYSSIGCEPCTSLPSDPNDPRSGRWSGRKQECGIHIQAQ
ncbi:phosphoadenylyl-sulfate reductase [Alloacidobacterium dinghuense]|uniref:Adenosine 5'-phosphosulfate reductase n=1 Tax=Alloacidobacterium dinghuense TaxID=2763107 RepID=A0A7G8BE48_9BACT|nr:phosphoadenylyl-sulfate reductase [Alloacidobacterium dinghuense]QNI30818.1 phosphoadenylyl-sulfate reductase [Alloacidobacterium dinghuense]